MAKYIRIAATLTDKQLSFIEKIGMESRRAGKRKLTMTQVIRATIDAAMELDLNLKEGFASEKELKDKVLAKLKSKK